MNLVVDDFESKAIDVDFLTVSKDLREKSLASILIKEIIRRNNKSGGTTGLFTETFMVERN